MYFWAVSLVDGCGSWLVLAWKSSLIHFHISSLKSATAYLQHGNGKTLQTRTLFFYKLTIFLMYLIFHLTILLFTNLLSSMSHCLIHGIVSFLSSLSCSPSLIWHHTQRHLVYTPRNLNKKWNCWIPECASWVSTWLQLKQHKYTGSYFYPPWQSLTFFSFLDSDNLMDEIVYHFCSISISLINLISSFSYFKFAFFLLHGRKNFPSVFWH